MKTSRVLAVFAIAVLVSSISGEELKPTPDVGAGPNHKPGAPYRAKLSPPLAQGTVLLVRGHVRAADTGEPIAGVVLDAYQADARGKYDMDGFDYRARLLTDEQGYFELETIHPANYGPPPHIHFVITHPEYRTLKTELFFEDDLESLDRAAPAELVTELVRHEVDGAVWEEGRFDVVLVPGQ
jgi:protocatechuate 3,4-dioxygenase beta subunit